MFGLEKQKKGKGSEEFVFELEQELKDRSYFAKVKKQVEERIQLIKNALRSGESKEEFDKYGQLLHGYTALLKVLNRIKGK